MYVNVPCIDAMGLIRLYKLTLLFRDSMMSQQNRIVSFDIVCVFVKTKGSLNGRPA